MSHLRDGVKEGFVGTTYARKLNFVPFVKTNRVASPDVNFTEAKRKGVNSGARNTMAGKPGQSVIDEPT